MDQNEEIAGTSVVLFCSVREGSICFEIVSVPSVLDHLVGEVANIAIDEEPSHAVCRSG